MEWMKTNTNCKRYVTIVITTCIFLIGYFFPLVEEDWGFAIACVIYN